MAEKTQIEAEAEIEESFVAVDHDTLIAQIGKGNVMSISGGRIMTRETGVTLPVRYGYTVEVDYAANDTYVVRRVYETKSARIVKGTKTNVYADEVGEVAYRASCYKDEF